MDKVYSKKEFSGCWWLKQLTDIFYFKAVNITDNTSENYILSWTRNCDLSEFSDNPVRRYDIEIDNVRYYFLVYTYKDEWILKPEDLYKFEKICQEKNLIFTGVDFDIV